MPARGPRGTPDDRCRRDRLPDRRLLAAVAAVAAAAGGRAAARRRHRRPAGSSPTSSRSATASTRRTDPLARCTPGPASPTTRPPSRRTSAGCTPPSGSPPAGCRSHTTHRRRRPGHRLRLRHRTDQHRAGRAVYVGAQHLSRDELHDPHRRPQGRADEPARTNSAARPSCASTRRTAGTTPASTGRGGQADRHPGRVPDRRGAGGEGRPGSSSAATEHADAGRLKTQLVTKKRFPGSSSAASSTRSMDVDRKRLIDYYHALGFLAVQVTPEVVRSARPGARHRRVPHRRGPAVPRGRSSRSTGTSRSRRTRLRGAHRAEARRAVRPRTWSRPTSQRIKDYYGNRGYHGRRSSRSRCTRCPASRGVVQVHYNVVEGRPRRAGPRRADHHRGEHGHRRTG